MIATTDRGRLASELRKRIASAQREGAMFVDAGFRILTALRHYDVPLEMPATARAGEFTIAQAERYAAALEGGAHG